MQGQCRRCRAVPGENKKTRRSRDGKGLGYTRPRVLFAFFSNRYSAAVFYMYTYYTYRIKDEEVLINEWFKGLTAADEKRIQYVYIYI